MDKLLKSLKIFDKVCSMDLKKAYDYGYDCGKNGANTENCHFTIFSNGKFTKAWERGKKAALKAKGQ